LNSYGEGFSTESASLTVSSHAKSPATPRQRRPPVLPGEAVEHLFAILTSEYRVFYFYLVILQFTYFSCVAGFCNFMFRVLVFRRSGIPAFHVLVQAENYCSFDFQMESLKFPAKW